MSMIPGDPSRRAAGTPRYDDIGAGYGYGQGAGPAWLTFAAIMLGIAGVFGVIDGIVAVSKSSFYAANAEFVFSGLNTWGWIILVVGVAALLAAFYVMSGSEWARWTGIVVAALQAIAQLLMIQAYPLWSLCVFALDVLVIYGLAAHGGSRARQEA
jgi:hypothetical protein